MTIRTSILALAVGCFAAGCITEDNATEETTGTEMALLGSPAPSNWSCKSVLSVVSCVGHIGILPSKIEVGDVNVDVIDDVKLELLSNILNDLSILNGNKILTDILNDFTLTVKDFLDVEDNDVNVCVLPVLTWVCNK